MPIGVNHHGFINKEPYTGPPPNLDATSFPEIAKTGAVAVKIAWGTPENEEHYGHTLAELDAQVQAAIDAGLIPIVAMYDAIGPDHWSDGTFEHTIRWFESQPIRDWVNGVDANGHSRSEYLILNLAVEAGPGTGSPYRSYINRYSDAITRLRDCTTSSKPCFTVPLMIDADNWGRDDASLVAGASSWDAADPLHNIVLDWHEYSPLSVAQIKSSMNALEGTGLPVIVGEFAHKDPAGGSVTYPTACLGSSVRYNDIAAQANLRGFGWLPWAWGDKPTLDFWNADCWEYDMTDTQLCSSLQRWGCEIAITNADSIANTATRSRYLIDRCGTEPPRPAAGSCGDSCGT